MGEGNFDLLIRTEKSRSGIEITFAEDLITFAEDLMRHRTLQGDTLSNLFWGIVAMPENIGKSLAFRQK
ncbi:hypothetical protein RB625 [Rhodopirellula baltica SH 1]|uniref:Uncharacterized protein n=1 Tax=Rhodopirellula baltica (strain DSM 10527 / NCIMB 13988 / SH1) TaxID=243090 RepID=Q7UYG6_RHOBA|nr:hypothetical protein RB625 [Rhodopirellula baltica SH 1]